MNIFKLDEKEFDKKLDDIFDNIDPNALLEDLISCGLKIEKKAEYNTHYIEEYDYSIEFSKKSFWDKFINKKEDMSENLMEAA